MSNSPEIPIFDVDSPEELYRVIFEKYANTGCPRLKNLDDDEWTREANENLGRPKRRPPVHVSKWQDSKTDQFIFQCLGIDGVEVCDTCNLLVGRSSGLFNTTQKI